MCNEHLTINKQGCIMLACLRDDKFGKTRAPIIIVAVAAVVLTLINLEAFTILC